ncbi:hypothetical protein HN011_003486 [Eciton burchellii]|nr:hypothetical protein HN011_003486 [Eciton burchellii]
MKLDVSDVLYDSSSVSSDSGTSQSSRVSHDFLSSIASTAVLPNNVSTDRIILQQRRIAVRLSTVVSCRERARKRAITSQLNSTHRRPITSHPHYVMRHLGATISMHQYRYNYLPLGAAWSLRLNLTKGNVDPRHLSALNNFSSIDILHLSMCAFVYEHQESIKCVSLENSESSSKRTRETKLCKCMSDRIAPLKSAESRGMRDLFSGNSVKASSIKGARDERERNPPKSEN